MEKIKILIADDHKLIRETWIFLLNSYPGFKVIAACQDTTEAICLAHLEKPEIVLMDININPFNGFQATARILLVSPNTKVIGLSFHNEHSMVHKMFDAGAKAYVTKNSSWEEVEEAIHCVRQGGEYLCKELQNSGFRISDPHQSAFNKLELLTKKEKQVSQLMKDGLRAKDISSKLNISVKTVDVHRTNILKKLCLKSSLALVHMLNAAEKKMEYS